MAKIGRLNVELGAETGGLKRDLKHGKTMLSKFSKDADGALGGLLSKGSTGISMAASGISAAMKTIAVSATAAGAALAYFTKSQIDAIGDGADAAKKLGLPYNGLKRIQLAAKLAGIEADSLNTSFEKMQDTLGSALSGNSAAIQSLDRIGITMAQLAGMKPEQRFEAIANAINRIEDPAQKLAASRDIFGKQGGALVSLFDGVSSKIGEASDKLDNLGVLMTDLELSGVEAAGDAFDGMKTALEGIGTQLAKEVSPAITKAWDNTEDWIKSMGGIEEITDNGLTKMADELERIGNAASYASAMFDSMKEGAGIAAEGTSKAAEIASYALPDRGASGRAIASGVGALIDYGQEDVKGRAKRGKKRVGKGMLGKGYERRGAGLGTMGREFAQSAKEDAARKQQDEKNAPAVEAAKQARQDMFKSMYEAEFGKPEKAIDTSLKASADLKTAEDDRLKTEESITKELEKQTAEKEGQAGQGSAKLMAFNGPVAMAAAADSMAQRKTPKGGVGMDETNNILRDMHGTLRGGVAARYS